MEMKKLYRPYTQDNKPITTKWYSDKEEAKQSGEMFYGKNIKVIQKDINSLLKKRKKTGFRGLI